MCMEMCLWLKIHGWNTWMSRKQCIISRLRISIHIMWVQIAFLFIMQETYIEEVDLENLQMLKP